MSDLPLMQAATVNTNDHDRKQSSLPRLEMPSRIVYHRPPCIVRGRGPCSR